MSQITTVLPPITLDGDDSHGMPSFTVNVTVHDAALISTMCGAEGRSLEEAHAESNPEEFHVAFGPHGVEIYWLDADGDKVACVGVSHYGGKVSATVWDQFDNEVDHPMLDVDLSKLYPGFTGYGRYSRRG